jgi:NAD+ kinase
VRVVLVPNLGKERAVQVAGELSTWLSAKGIEPVMSVDDARGCGLETLGANAAELGDVVLAVALGGDGTILKAVHIVGEKEVPILGINLGRRGFLSGATGDHDVREAISSALSGDVHVERRATLEAHVIMEGRSVGRYRALNEINVGRGVAGRVVEATVSVNGIELAEFSCDGVIVATPTGSTAYALSAGGPIVSPDVPCFIVVPVAAHTLQSRTILVGSSDIVTISLPSPARREACIQIDGDLMPCRRSIESVEVKRCEHDVLLVKLDGRDFFDVVRSEFFGR